MGDPFSRPELHRFVEEFGQLKARWAKRMVPTLADAAAFLAERGWWILNDWSFDICAELLSFKDLLDERALTDLIVAYANDLRHHCISEMPQRWFNIGAFSARQTVLEECVWAHGQARYSLVVTCALVNVEGIVRDLLRHTMPNERQSYRFEVVRRQLAQHIDHADAFPSKTEPTWDQLRALRNFHNLLYLRAFSLTLIPPTPMFLWH